MKRIILIVVVAGLMFFAGKFYELLSHKEIANQSNEKDYTRADDSATVKYSSGEQIYKEKCVACHQLTGMGVSGAFPPLKGSDFLKNVSKRRLLIQVLKGSNEGITVNGVKYNSPMPPQVDNNKDAISVVNYILNAWGNNYGKAIQSDAKGIKAEKSGSPKMMHHMMMRSMMGHGR